jgi:hypothetical protein
MFAVEAVDDVGRPLGLVADVERRPDRPRSGDSPWRSLRQVVVLLGVVPPALHTIALMSGRHVDEPPVSGSSTARHSALIARPDVCAFGLMPQAIGVRPVSRCSPRAAGRRGARSGRSRPACRSGRCPRPRAAGQVERGGTSTSSPLLAMFRPLKRGPASNSMTSCCRSSIVVERRVDRDRRPRPSDLPCAQVGMCWFSRTWNGSRFHGYQVGPSMTRPAMISEYGRRCRPSEGIRLTRWSSQYSSANPVLAG